MYRPSRSRSRSVPRLRLPGGKGQGHSSTSKNGKASKEENRPAWDDTLQDLNKYKATPDTIARRKQQRVSKNNVALKRYSLDGNAARDQYQDDYASYGGGTPSVQHGFTPEASYSNRPTPQSTNNTPGAGGPSATSPAIDYNAVLKLLQKPPTPGQGTPEGLHHTRGADAHVCCSDNGDDIQHRFDQSPADVQTKTRQHHTSLLWPGGSSTNAIDTQVPQEQHEAEDEVINATLARIDLSSNMPSAGQLPASQTENSNKERASSTQVAGKGLLLPQQHTGAAGSGHRQVAAPQAAAAAVVDYETQQMLSSIQSKQQMMESHMTSLETLVHKLHYQHAATQERLGQVQEDWEHHKGTRAVANQQQQELQQLRQAIQQLQEEQGQLRAQFSEFSAHAGGLLTRLQAQLLQLLQSPAVTGGLSGGGVGPGSAQEDVASIQMPPPSSSAPYHTVQPVQSLAAATQPAVGKSLAHLSSASSQPVASHIGTATSTATGAGGGWRGDPTLPNFDDGLALPSYAAMRRSAASISSTSKPAAAAGSRPAAAPQGASGPSHSRDITGTPTTHHTASRWADMQPETAEWKTGMQQQSTAFGSTGSAAGDDKVAEHSDNSGGAGRSWPAQYQPRALGAGPVLVAGLSYGAEYSRAAAAAAPLNLPTAAWFSSTDAVSTDGAGAFPGMATSFGVLPEPMSFNVASDFKIVRVGGSGSAVQSHAATSGLTQNNSLSLAAHTAAALRSRQHRK